MARFIGRREPVHAGHPCPVEIHQAELGSLVDEDVAVLEVTVRDPCLAQVMQHVAPPVGQHVQRFRAALAEEPDVNVKRTARDPVHLDEWPRLALDPHLVVEPRGTEPSTTRRVALRLAVARSARGIAHATDRPGW